MYINDLSGNNSNPESHTEALNGQMTQLQAVKAFYNIIHSLTGGLSNFVSLQFPFELLYLHTVNNQ